MIRSRFFIDVDDYRPVKWPIKYPYWCTGEAPDIGYSIVTYTDTLDEIWELWPEAKLVEHSIVTEIIFSSRFPKPHWYSNDKDRN